MENILSDRQILTGPVEIGRLHYEKIENHEPRSKTAYVPEEITKMNLRTPGAVSLPPPKPQQTYVKVSALDSGYITLPERDFVTDADEKKRTTVPSMSFLLQHGGPRGRKLLFDLGLRKNLSDYPPHFRPHLKSREPITVDPDVVGSLKRGGLAAEDIDTVILSHVHYDHAGSPSNFPTADFIVGYGTHNLITKGIPGHRISLFDPNLLPKERTIELPSPEATLSNNEDEVKNGEKPSHYRINHKWEALGHLPHTIDLFGDGSLYIVDSPGHTPGHLNVLARTGPKTWVYLAGDAAHDMRLLTGEKGIGTWKTPDGRCHCIHLDREGAARTISRIAQFLQPTSDGSRVEIILAHDGEWDKNNRDKFFPHHI